MMEIGVSTACMYPMESEKALAYLGQNGVRLAELFVNDESELTASFISRFKNIAQEKQIEIRAVHSCHCAYESYYLFTDYPRRLVTGVRKYARLFDFAAALGARFVVMHGDKRDRPTTDAQYFSVFAQLQKRARSAGVELLQENVAPCKSADPLFLVRMAKAFGGDVGFVFDVKQAVRAGYEPLAFFKQIVPWVRHIHLNDHLAGRDCLLPGQGSFDLSRFRELLHRNEYDGALIIEVYRQNYREACEIVQANHQMRNVFGD